MIKERYKKYAAIIQRAKEDMIFMELSIILYEISFQQRILKDLSLDLHLKNRNSREIIY